MFDENDPPGSTLTRRLRQIAEDARLDAPARALAQLGSGSPRRVAARAREVLGHPLHPAVTDLPIGFWTSAWLLDLLPGRSEASAAIRRLYGLGVLSAVPAMFTGLGDAAELDDRGRRLAALHGMLNVAAAGAFTRSWWLRGRGRTVGAIVSAQLGAGLATAAGLIGGHLALSET